MAEALTVNQASELTGWSARMLRYIDDQGLVTPPRSGSDYRQYGAPELQRLRTLHDLLEHWDVNLHDLAFAKRMRDDADLGAAVSSWLSSEASRPEGVTQTDWLEWERERHALRWPRQLAEPETKSTLTETDR